MLLPELRTQVVRYAQQMATERLVSAREGNVSALDRVTNLIAISPSAADYHSLTPEDVVVIDKNGQIIEGCWQPTSETPLPR